jgi:transposase-like protein
MKRKRHSAAEWRRIIEKQAESGKSVRAYCGDQGIHAGVFYRKRQELAKAGSGFVEVGPFLTEPGAAVVIEGAGLTVHVNDLSALGAVVRELKGARC